MTKNFGTPPVTGYLVPEGRAWETVIFEAGKPILDRELNLSQDIDGGAAQAALRNVFPSGWLSGDPLSTSDAVGSIYVHTTTANALQIPNGLRAHVNGWLLNIQHSYANGSNKLDLGAGPAGAGAQRTDLVIVEVWRRLINAAPSTVGKSATARIWQEGNVATDPASDLTLNFADDTLDGTIGSETTARVQIQYRLRVIQNVDLFTSVSGMTDANTLAHSVPASAAAPDGVATAFPYANQSGNGDSGLWRAGDGNPSNTLGTVDGYMYALPLMGVFRRNTTAFARLTNQNGGVAYPGPSDRPDGYFQDVIEATDIVDLRSCVHPNGWDLSEVLEKNVNLILDNSKRTEIYHLQPYGGGNSGTTVFMANEIGGTPTGAAPGSADQQFDAVRRRFSARPVLETVSVMIDPPGLGWVDGAQADLDPTSMAIYPYTAFNWAASAPADVMFLDVLDAHWVGTNAVGQKYIDAMPYIGAILGLGSLPIVTLNIFFGAITALGLSTEKLSVTLTVQYPAGVGLTHTPISDFGANSFAMNTGPLSVAAPTSFASFSTQTIDATHREARLEYQTSSLTYDFRNDATPLTSFRLPERAISVSSPAGVLDANGYVFTPTVPIVGNAAVSVQYVAQRALPKFANPQMVIYFRTAAPQMATPTLLGTTLSLVPRLTSQKIWSLIVGAGSQDEGYPFPQAYVQTGGVFPTNPGIPTYQGEVDLLGSGHISVADFDAQTGMLQLPVYVPMVPSPEALVLERSLTDVDIENRTYFTGVTLSPEPPFGYLPNAFGQELSAPDRHKNIYPILAELAEDSPLGPRGQLVVVLFVRYASFDEDNGVYFETDLNANTTSASVFRVKGLLLNKGA